MEYVCQFIVYRKSFNPNILYGYLFIKLYYFI
jgi:hypothetical protein